MVNNLFNSFTEQAKTMVEPAFKLNQLLFANTEKLVKAQVDCFTSYAELGIEQLHEAASIKEFGELKEFVNKQAEVAGNLSKKMSDDANKFMTIGLEIRDDLSRLSQDGVQAVSMDTPVKPAAKKTGK